MKDVSPSIPRGVDGEFAGSPRYEVLRRLGTGGFGVVYEAYDREASTVVALKALHRLTPEGLFALKQEFRALADVSHPNLVALYELAEHDGHWFFTMEKLDGCDFIAHVRPSRETAELPLTVALGEEPAPQSTLGSREGPIDRRGRDLSVPRLRAALPQLVEGVIALHQLGMLHRDIKPSNVMVTRGGRVVLLDFGLARPASSVDPSSARIRLDAPPGPEPTAIVGTPEYMSPEQSVGGLLTPASDWYAVGTMLYEALCGRRPYVGTVAEIVAERQYNDPPKPSTLARDVPPDLEALAMDLLRRDPALRPTAAQIARAVGAQGVHSLSVTMTSSDLLVGRDEALATLRDALAETAPSHPVVVEVYGPSGVGKSALVGKYLDIARNSRAAIVLTGRCDERKSVPFKALDGVVDALSLYLRSRPREELAALVPRGMEALAALFPVLSFDRALRLARPEIEQDDRPSDHLSPPRAAAFAALRELLARASALRPMVIAVDDLQWSDADSAALLRELLTGPEAPSVLFIATIRGAPGQGASPFDTLESAALDRRTIDLRPLDERDALTLARTLLRPIALQDASMDSEDRAEREARRIAREAGGSPFFVGELARYAAERGSAEPVSLRSVVLARVEALPSDAKTLLELVSVVGQPLPQRVIFAASGLGAAAYPAMRVLRAANMVRVAGAKEADSVEAYHDRIRETVLASLSAEALRDRHRAIVRVLEAQREHDASLLAEHLAGAGELRRAAEWALIAAQQADRAFAFDRAARWYEAALSWGGAGGRARAELLAHKAHSLANCGRNGAAAEAFLEAAELVDEPMRSIELRRHAGVQLFIDGRHEDGLRTIHRVSRELGMSIPSSPLALAAGLAADTAWLRLRGLRFHERAAERIDPRTLQRLDLLQYAGLGTAFADSLLSMWLLTRFTRAAIEVGKPVRVGLALLRCSTTVIVLGPAHERRALEMLRAAEDLSIRHRDPYLRGCIDLGYGFTDLVMGRWSQGVARCERALDLLSKVPGAVWDADTAATFVIEGLTNQGKLALAFRRAARQGRDARDRNFVAGLIRNELRWETLRQLLRDDVRAARATLADASAKIPSDRFLFGHLLEMLGRASLAIYEGAGASLLPWMRERWPKLERSLMLTAQTFRAPTLMALGGVVLSAARAQTGVTRRNLVAEADALGKKLANERGSHVRARGLALRAGAAAIGGDEGLALSLYRATLQTFETADMQLHAAAAKLAVGSIIGGDEGRALVAQGTRALTDQGVVKTARFAEVYVPQPRE